jgi:hypothetical protein
MVDARDLKSLGSNFPCRFKSGRPHHKNLSLDVVVGVRDNPRNGPSPVAMARNRGSLSEESHELGMLNPVIVESFTEQPV